MNWRANKEELKMTEIPASVVKRMVCHLQHGEHSPGERGGASRTTVWHDWLILRNSVLGLRREVELKLNVKTQHHRVATEEQLNVTALLFTL